MVEFFKTDASRRCPRCGVRVTNPEVARGCAQWCAHAKDCLGHDPQAAGPLSEALDSVADRLLALVKAEFGSDQRRITHALLVLEQAESIMREEGGDPRVIVAAALLHDIGIPAAERKYGSAAAPHQEREGPPLARRLLAKVGFERTEIDQICEIIAHHHRGGPGTLEFRIIWDADHLVNLASHPERRAETRAAGSVEAAFRTPTGQRLARQWLAAQARG